MLKGRRMLYLVNLLIAKLLNIMRNEMSIDRGGFSYRIFVRKDMVGLSVYEDNINSQLIDTKTGYKNVIKRIKGVATQEELLIIEKWIFELLL